MNHPAAVEPSGEGHVPVAAVPTGGGLASRVSDHVAMTKPRITALVVVTAWVGLVLGERAVRGQVGWGVYVATLVGTALACMGAAVLNAAVERDSDALMQRTRGRPLPAGRIGRGEATASGLLMSVAGVLMLAWWGGWLAAGLTGATVGLYVGLYTPMKRWTWWNTVVGAVPGAMPPLIGYAAATGGLGLGLGAWLVFAIVGMWQLPHFWAIAYLYREDYHAAGLVMLPGPGVDPTGDKTRWAVLLTAVGTAVAGVLPWVLGVSGPWSAGVAAAAGAGLVATAALFWRTPTRPTARRVFLMSLIYLPPVLAAIVLDPA